MAEFTLVSNEQSTVADVIEVFFTSEGDVNGHIIKSFTAANNTETNQSYKAYIFDALGTVSPAIIPRTIIIRDKSDLGLSIIGQIIPVNGTLRIESSSADGISFTVVGSAV